MCRSIEEPKPRQDDACDERRDANPIPVIIDDEFARRIKEGDEELIKTFYDDFSPRIVSYIQYFIHSFTYNPTTQLPIDPEDILHEIFARFLQRRHRLHFDNPQTLFRWMIVCARNLIIDHRRHTASKPENYSVFWESTIHIPAAAPSDRQIDVLSFFRTLSPMDQKLFFSYYYEGNKSREIAENVGKSDGWVRNRLYLIRLNLIKFFTDGRVA